jgi:dihydrofolate reductase
MQRLIVFNHVSIDGYFVDAQGGMSFAHRAANNDEWNAFVSDNARGDAEFLFGRVTYEMMAGFWPTEMAVKNMPDVARKMNEGRKTVFSRSLERADWNNTTLVKGNLAEEVGRMKKADGPGIVIFGSGSIVSQLTDEGLIDEYQLVINPIVLGAGRTMFAGLKAPRGLRLKSAREFSNGNLVVSYEQSV